MARSHRGNFYDPRRFSVVPDRSAPKGRDWRKAVYGAVGVLSAQEQTEAVLVLARQRSYVDVTRVGVWGWSGGGTNTLNLMFRAPDLFRVGVAVAPLHVFSLIARYIEEHLPAGPQ